MRHHPLAIALAAGLLPVLLASRALAQGGDSDWLDGDMARSFRHRVIELALIYEASSGIDPAGYKVEARRTGPLVDGCARVEVTSWLQGQVARRETLAACKRH